MQLCKSLQGELPEDKEQQGIKSASLTKGNGDFYCRMIGGMGCFLQGKMCKSTLAACKQPKTALFKVRERNAAVIKKF